MSCYVEVIWIKNKEEGRSRNTLLKAILSSRISLHICLFLIVCVKHTTTLAVQPFHNSFLPYRLFGSTSVQLFTWESDVCAGLGIHSRPVALLILWNRYLMVCNRVSSGLYWVQVFMNSDTLSSSEQLLSVTALGGLGVFRRFLFLCPKWIAPG